MTGTVQSRYTNEQVTAWLQGLMTIAWADGQFDEAEQTLIADLIHEDLAADAEVPAFQPISPAQLADALGKDVSIADNFLRMAVMVALADGSYSAPEDALIQQIGEAFGHRPAILNSLHETLSEESTELAAGAIAASLDSSEDAKPNPNVLAPVQEWLDHLEIHDPRLAHFLCRAIPAQCPFERDVVVFGRKIAHIPAMCKINPLYEQLVGLRFRALSYLADECGEDVAPYC